MRALAPQAAKPHQGGLPVGDSAPERGGSAIATIETASGREAPRHQPDFRGGPRKPSRPALNCHRPAEMDLRSLQLSSPSTENSVGRGLFNLRLTVRCGRHSERYFGRQSPFPDGGFCPPSILLADSQRSNWSSATAPQNERSLSRAWPGKPDCPFAGGRHDRVKARCAACERGKGLNRRLGPPSLGRSRRPSEPFRQVTPPGYWPIPA